MEQGEAWEKVIDENVEVKREQERAKDEVMAEAKQSDGMKLAKGVDQADCIDWTDDEVNDEVNDVENEEGEGEGEQEKNEVGKQEAVVGDRLDGRRVERGQKGSGPEERRDDEDGQGGRH